MSRQFVECSEDEQIAELTVFARCVLEAYELGDASIRNINHGYNSTFAVGREGHERFALRVNVNSRRTIENLRAEIAWVENLAAEGSLNVPRPVPALNAQCITTRWCEPLGRETSAVLFTWLPGEEVHDLADPLVAMKPTGRLLARLHQLGRAFVVPDDGALAVLSDAMWGFNDHLRDSTSGLDAADRALFSRALERVDVVVAALYEKANPQIIHADVHGANLMWHEGTLSVFDFDDCALGLPLQDLALTMYYFDEPEQRRAIIDGYRELADLPEVREIDLEVLYLQRRLQLLNYLLETENPTHQKMLDNYLAISRDHATRLLERA